MFPTGNNLIEVFEARVRLSESKPVYKFLSTDELSHEINFKDFYGKAMSYAATLQRLDHLMPGDRALILYPPGLDYIAVFYACILAGIIAVPAYPPDYKNVDRVTSIIKDCAPSVILTNDQIAEQLKKYFAQESMRAPLVVSLCSGPLAEDTDYKRPKPDKSTIAFLQYTSGSTSAPKGVTLTHDNLIANSRCISKAMEHREHSEAVSWLPPYHDMGLIGCIIHPFIAGMKATLMSPMFFVKKPKRWLKAISDITTSDHISSPSPNFGFELCNEKISDSEVEALDLSKFKVAICGAEPIRISTYSGFVQKFGKAGFREQYFIPVYGLAESTLIVSGGVTHKSPVITTQEDIKGENKGSQLMSCGQAVAEHEIIIADPETLEECPAGGVGEIWVKGRSVAMHYWNKQRDEDNTFNAFTSSGRGPYLRTGDLGFKSDAGLHISGRLKDCLIISGKKHYPQDIEHTISNVHSNLRKDCTAVFTVQDPSRAQDGCIVAVQEVVRVKNIENNFNEIFGMIRKEVFQRHSIALEKIVFIEQSSIPKTSSGKIQRQKTRELFLQNKLTVLATS